MQFQISRTKEAVSELSTGSSYISKSGVYPVTLKFVSIATSKNGAQSLNFNLTHEGNDQTIYGQTIVNSDGKPNEIGMKLMNKLGILANLDDGDGINVEEEQHPAGKDQKIQTFAVIQEFSGLEVLAHLKEEYSRYNGEITKSMTIQGLFRPEDKATPEEIVDEKDYGKRYNELTMTRTDKNGAEYSYATAVTYRDSKKGANDAPTPEEVEAWKESKKTGAKGASAPAPAVNKAATAFTFGKK
jgi:hypothetical protein